MNGQINRLWSQGIADLRPYTPGPQPNTLGTIKLNTNESPFGPSPNATRAIQNAAMQGLNLYPDPNSLKLRNAIAAYHGVALEQVYVGNGSDEVLAHAFVALLRQDLPVLFPDVTYGFYPVFCNFFNMAFQVVPLASDMTIQLEDYDRSDNPVVFPNPNAPTGLALSLQDMKDWIVRRPNRPVVVDEAYVDFGAETTIPLVEECKNLLVVRTMSKSRGLAGLRVGYAIGNSDLIQALNRVKNSLNSYPVGQLSEAGGIASIQDDRYFRRTISDILKNRNRLTVGLAILGFQTLPSLTNFVFARSSLIDGIELAAALNKRNILVRHFQGPRTESYVRITVGTEYEVVRLLEEIKVILAE